MKLCRTCGNEYPVSEFGVRVASIDGLSAKCRKCAKEYDVKRANLPHRVKARLLYSKTPNGIKAGNKAKLAYTERNMIKKAASGVVCNAVRDGRLLKPDECSNCGNKPKRLHGHHDDYAYPMTVRWLCAGCHTVWHKKNGKGLNG